jgi:Lrp/AsnC family transcriptional regulator for asnA, asnC and gidA
MRTFRKSISTKENEEDNPMTDDSSLALDMLDLSILSHLHSNSRKSFSDIARGLDVAVNTVRNRVNKMVDNGIITFITRIVPEKIGLQAYANILIAAESDKIDSITEELLTYPEVSFISLIIGQFDILLDVMCYDNQHLKNLIMERIRKIPGVKRTETLIMIKVLRWNTLDIMANKDHWVSVKDPLETS